MTEFSKEDAILRTSFLYQEYSSLCALGTTKKSLQVIQFIHNQDGI